MRNELFSLISYLRGLALARLRPFSRARSPDRAAFAAYTWFFDLLMFSKIIHSPNDIRLGNFAERLEPPADSWTETPCTVSTSPDGLIRQRRW